MLRLTETRGSRAQPPPLARMSRLLPSRAIGADLRRLLHMEGLAGFVVLECRALQVHPELCRPDRGGVRASTPPDPLAQAIGVGFQAQQPGRIWKHRSWIRPREAFAAQEVQEHFRM